MSEMDNIINKNNSLLNIKCNYILIQIFNNLKESKLLNIIKYNNFFKSKLNRDINDYKNYLNIEIEIIPNNVIKNEYEFDEFIHINFNAENKFY